MRLSKIKLAGFKSFVDPTVISFPSNLVIGVIQPIAGKYGISKNPESFAVYGNRKYFSDENNNVILRLAGGIEEISSNGMKDFFRDQPLF